jgi:hypothetical protein
MGRGSRRRPRFRPLGVCEAEERRRPRRAERGRFRRGPEGHLRQLEEVLNQAGWPPWFFPEIGEGRGAGLLSYRVGRAGRRCPPGIGPQCPRSLTPVPQATSRVVRQPPLGPDLPEAWERSLSFLAKYLQRPAPGKGGGRACGPGARVRFAFLLWWGGVLWGRRKKKPAFARGRTPPRPARKGPAGGRGVGGAGSGSSRPCSKPCPPGPAERRATWAGGREVPCPTD